MSQSSFSLSVRNDFLDTYRHRCVLCIAYLPPNGAQCAYIIDQSETTGRRHLVEAQRLGLLQGGFQRGSSDNGFLLCPTCHLSYFTTNHIAFSPSLPVLQYIRDYLAHTPVADQLALHEVFRLLRLRQVDDLPDPSQILDYLDLYVVVPLLADGLRARVISTLAQPRPFIFDSEDNIFREGAGDPTNPNSVFIFQPAHIAERNDAPTSGPLLNLLSPDPLLYWQLSTPTEIILAMVTVQGFDTQDVCEEIDIIDQIRTSLSQRAIYIRHHGGTGGRGSGAGGAGGTSGGVRRGRSATTAGRAGGARRGVGGVGTAAAIGAGGSA